MLLWIGAVLSATSSPLPSWLGGTDAVAIPIFIMVWSPVFFGFAVAIALLLLSTAPFGFTTSWVGDIAVFVCGILLIGMFLWLDWRQLTHTRDRLLLGGAEAVVAWWDQRQQSRHHGDRSSGSVAGRLKDS
jgi:hypothetical protein